MGDGGGGLPRTLQATLGVHGAAAVLTAVEPAWWPAAAGAVLANHALLTAAGLWPRCQAFGKTLIRLPDPAGRVALTFDDGPDPEVTPRVLDLLDRFGVTASFFCIGARARRHPALLRRMTAAGHGVENHTLTHPLMFCCYGIAALRREIGAAQALLADITGQAPRWFRPPMGFRSPLLDPVLREAGLQSVAWTRRGYDTACGNPAIVLRRLSRGLGAGDVLMLHDGGAAHTPDGAAVALQVLPPLLTALAAQGLNGAALPAATAAAAAAAGTRPSALYASR